MCPRCRVKAGTRTILISCMYDASEIMVPFEESHLTEKRIKFYGLDVCQDCRADFLEAVKAWFFARGGEASRDSGGGEKPSRELPK